MMLSPTPMGKDTDKEMSTDYITLTPEMAESVEDLADVREQMKSLRGTEKELRDTLLAVLEDAQASHGMTASGVQIVTLRTNVRRVVNRDKLEALFESVADQVIEERESKTLVLG